MFSRSKRADIFGLALGIYATISQVVLIRESLGVSGGNELTVGLSFAMWLVGVGVGAIVAGKLPRPGAALIGGSIVSPVFMIGGFLVLRLHREVLDVARGMDPSLLGFVALVAVGLGAGGLTVGFLFIAVSRAAGGEEETPVSRLYAAEALGALIGGLVFTFALAGRVPHLVAMGFAGSLPAGAVAIQGRDRAAQLSTGALFAAFIGLSALGPFQVLDRLTEVRAFAALGSAEELVAVRDSAYGRLTLGRSEGELALLADNRLVHTFPDPWERPVPLHLALSQHPAPERVLLVGGGPSDRLAAALAHGLEKVVLTYLDEAAHELCRPFWSNETRVALDDPRVAVIRDDGRRYVSSTTDRFDVVLIAARPPRSGQTNRYHTREFFAAVRGILRPGGVMAVLAPGGANLLAPEAARTVAFELATVRSVFQEVVAVPGLETILYAATEKGVVTDDPELLRTRYEARGVKSTSFSSRRFASLLAVERVDGLHRQIDQWPAEINTDLKPIAYLSALQLWERSMRDRVSGDSTWTGLAEKWAWLWLAIPLAIWLLWQGLALGRRRPAGGASIVAIATTGAAGMAAEIVVIYVFQAASGQLYTGLAMLAALFMAGLAAGAFFARRYFASGLARDGIVAEVTMLAFLIVSGPVLNAAMDSVSVVAGWSAVAGLVTGIAFPALLGQAARRSGDERRVAAVIEAADHFGAATGAVVTGVIWLPVFGTTVTCLMFAVLKMASLIGLVLNVSKTR
ncbi:MAG: hypothetical protein GY854_15530 [Deltaproteobacteria bacterium]|nr:hypothetical protein [Deltaproteobacteria bacterium]